MRVVNKSVGLIVVGVLLGIAGSMATPRIKAHVVTGSESGQVVQPGQPAEMITGDNIGFQLVATTTTNQGDVATGKLMIKVNGRWLPAAIPTGVMPAR